MIIFENEEKFWEWFMKSGHKTTDKMKILLEDEGIIFNSAREIQETNEE